MGPQTAPWAHQNNKKLFENAIVFLRDTQFADRSIREPDHHETTLRRYVSDEQQHSDPFMFNTVCLLKGIIEFNSAKNRYRGNLVDQLVKAEIDHLSKKILCKFKFEQNPDEHTLNIELRGHAPKDRLSLTPEDFFRKVSAFLEEQPLERNDLRLTLIKIAKEELAIRKQDVALIKKLESGNIIKIKIDGKNQHFIFQEKCGTSFACIDFNKKNLLSLARSKSTSSYVLDPVMIRDIKLVSSENHIDLQGK